MPPTLALFLCLCFIAFLFVIDRRKDSPVTYASLLPLVWVMFVASRPLSLWLNFNAPSQSLSPQDYLEGNPIDRANMIVMMFAAITVLTFRKIDWLKLLRGNVWLFMYFMYAGLTVLGSDFEEVSFKRWLKSVGEMLILLVVATEPEPVETFKELLKRCAYVLVPISIVFIKYYPNMGVVYSPWGTLEYAGASYSKNGLGNLCLVSALFFSWSLISWIRTGEFSQRKKEVLIYVFYLGMIAWLFAKARSATSLLCFLVGLAVVFGMQLPIVRQNTRHLGWFYLFMILAVVSLELLFNVSSAVLSGVGRDVSLTGRTDLWENAVRLAPNPMIGAGYESFWLGDRLRTLWSIYWWQPIQAHNGYIEVYLNLGLLGLLFLFLLLWSTGRNIKETLMTSYDFGNLCLALFTGILFFNVTEASFKPLHLMWNLLILIFTISTACVWRTLKRAPEAEPEDA
jgi:O-antigen ligase